MASDETREATRESISALRIRVGEPTDDVVRSLQEASRSKLGYVRNFLKLPFGPGLLSLYQGYLDRLMRGNETKLSPRERELIALVVSAENRCEVCVISHATALEKHGMPKNTVDIICLNWRRAEVPAREKAMMEFAWRLTAHAAEADVSYLGVLRDAGVSELEILEAAQIVAIYNANNRFNSVIGLHVNVEAHDLYRIR